MNWRVFGWPLALGTIALAGLISALIGDGIWDVLSWLLLGGTLAVLAWHGSGFRKP